MEEFELEKETYEKVVSLIQSGKNAKALEAILPEANDDSSLSRTILEAIAIDLMRRPQAFPTKGKGPEKEKGKESEKKGGSSSAESDSPPTTSILLPSEPAPHRKKKATLLGGHQGIEGIELEKETFHEAADLIRDGKRDEALDLIFEEANQNETLAMRILDSIEKLLAETPATKLTSSLSVSPSPRNEKPKEEKRQDPIAESPQEKPQPIAGELDPFERAKKGIRRSSLIVFLCSGLFGYFFYRSGMRPLKAILTNFVICLIAGLSIGYGYFAFTNHSDGKRPGSDPADQETLNYVAVAMCPLLAYDLDLHAGQRNFCNRKRSRFAYYLYEESRKIDGLDTIRGPFSEETLQAGLYIMGNEIKGQLNRGQRKQFLSLYESRQWPPVDIVDDDGRLRLEYPTYGNAPGVVQLSVASRE